MPYFQFLWSPQTIRHLADNQVSQADFEDVVSHPDDLDLSRSTGEAVAFGYTVDGRYLMAVYRPIDELTIEPVTAYVVPEPRRELMTRRSARRINYDPTPEQLRQLEAERRLIADELPDLVDRNRRAR